MYSFFVLGLVPGTNIQITFQIWTDSILLAVETVGVIWLYRRHSDEFNKFIPATAILACRFYYDAYLNVLTQFKAFLLSQTATWD